MATTVIQRLQSRTRSLRSMPHLVLGWVLVIPLVFYAVHGTPSFESVREKSHQYLFTVRLNFQRAQCWGRRIHPHSSCRFFNCHVVAGDQREASFFDSIANEAANAAGSAYHMFFSMVTRSSQVGLQRMLLLDRDACLPIYLVPSSILDEIRSVVMMAGLAISVVGLAMVFLTPQFSVATVCRDGVAWTGLFTDRTPTGKAMVFLLSPAIVFSRKDLNTGTSLYILLLSFLALWRTQLRPESSLVLYIAVMAVVSSLHHVWTRSSVVIAGIVAAAGVFALCWHFVVAPVAEGAGKECYFVWTHGHLGPCGLSPLPRDRFWDTGSMRFG